MHDASQDKNLAFTSTKANWGTVNEFCRACYVHTRIDDVPCAVAALTAYKTKLKRHNAGGAISPKNSFHLWGVRSFGDGVS